MSFSPWPVRTQTTVLPGSRSIDESAARPAADDGSQKMPSRLARSSHIRVMSSSVTATGSTLLSATSASTSARCAGSAMRIAEASVVDRSTACAEIIRSCTPSSAKPFA